KRETLRRMRLVEIVETTRESRLPAERRLTRVGQIRIDARLSVIVPEADRVRRAKHRRDIVGELDLPVGHAGVKQAGSSGYVGRRTELVRARVTASRTGRQARARNIEQRLTLTVLIATACPERESAEPVAEGGVGERGPESSVGPIEIVVLQRLGLLYRPFERARLARRDLHHCTHRIARVRRRVGAIHDVDARYLLGRYESPSWPTDRVVVGDQCGKRNAIGIYETARAGTHSPDSRPDGRLRITVVPFANVQAWQVFNRIFGIDEIDRLLRLLGGDARRHRQREKLEWSDARFATALRRNLNGAELRGAVSGDTVTRCLLGSRSDLGTESSRMRQHARNKNQQHQVRLECPARQFRNHLYGSENGRCYLRAPSVNRSWNTTSSARWRTGRDRVM